MCITEIKGGDNRTIADPDDIRGEINKHIQEILRDSNLLTSDHHFIDYITDENTKYNLLTDKVTDGKLHLQAKKNCVGIMVLPNTYTPRIPSIPTRSISKKWNYEMHNAPEKLKSYLDRQYTPWNIKYVLDGLLAIWKSYFNITIPANSPMNGKGNFNPHEQKRGGDGKLPPNRPSERNL